MKEQQQQKKKVQAWTQPRLNFQKAQNKAVSSGSGLSYIYTAYKWSIHGIIQKRLLLLPLFRLNQQTHCFRAPYVCGVTQWGSRWSHWLPLRCCTGCYLIPTNEKKTFIQSWTQFEPSWGGASCRSETDVHPARCGRWAAYILVWDVKIVFDRIKFGRALSCQRRDSFW